MTDEGFRTRGTNLYFEDAQKSGVYVRVSLQNS